jgi:energy-converting hydrogenase A subunit M
MKTINNNSAIPLFILILVSCNYFSLNALNIKRKNLNSFGKRVKANTIINSYPFKLERCDQVVMIKGEYIKFGKEYLCLKKGLFLITSQAINIFEDESPDSLKDSLDLSDLYACSSKLRPSEKCLDLTTKYNQRMTICSEFIDRINEVLMDFSECRKGNPIKPKNAKECIIGKFVDGSDYLEEGYKN